MICATCGTMIYESPAPASDAEVARLEALATALGCRPEDIDSNLLTEVATVRGRTWQDIQTADDVKGWESDARAAVADHLEKVERTKLAK